MITVIIEINGHPIYVRTAVNISIKEIRDDEANFYHLDTDKKIIHVPNKGAVVLAKKMLDTIIESK